MRTKRNECWATGKHLHHCYYSQYNKETRETERIGNGEESWQKFRTAEENGIKHTIYAKYGTYDGSGYVQDFYVPPTNLSVYQKTIKKHMTDDFFSESVRAIVLSWTIYHASLNNWQSVSLVYFK